MTPESRPQGTFKERPPWNEFTDFLSRFGLPDTNDQMFSLIEDGWNLHMDRENERLNACILTKGDILISFRLQPSNANVRLEAAIYPMKDGERDPHKYGANVRLPNIFHVRTDTIEVARVTKNLKGEVKGRHVELNLATGEIEAFTSSS